MAKGAGIMFPLSPQLWVATIGGVLILALGAGLKIQTSRLDSCKTEAAQFQATVKAQGELAAQVAKKRDADNKVAMETANAKTKRDMDSLLARYNKLRNTNPGGGGLPAAPSVTSSTKRTCFDTTGLANAMGVLEAGVPRITEQGDVARLRLSSAAEWAASISHK